MICEFYVPDLNNPDKKVCKKCGRPVVSSGTPEKTRANCQTAASQMKTESIGLTDKAINFGKAMVQHILDRGELASQQVIDERLKICRACEHLIIKNEEPFQGECAKCGCRCNSNRILVNKVAIPSQSCPEGKWEAI